VSALQDVRARPYIADALGGLGDPRAKAPLLALLAEEPYVTTRPHEARALLALGAQAAAFGAGASEATATVAVPAGPARLLVLLSDAEAALEGSLDGQALPPAGDGPVRSLELGRGHPARVRVALHASTGDVVALWVASTGRLD
jgi:hypothetical protein